MAGIFISHSSADKPFVNRLAIDLVNRGMPVWFDTWEMSTGDSLQEKIFEGIGASDYVIVVLSPSSVASEWVQKELAAALALEEERARKFVLPIRIAGCDNPLALGDRLYADFSASYLEPLEQLVAMLRKLGLGQLTEPPGHALVPLVFENGVYLDGVQFERRVKGLQPRFPDGFQFAFDQFVVAPDERYNELRHRLTYRKEHIQDDPHYSPDISRDFSHRYDGVFNLERKLIEGIRLIVNAYIAADYPTFDVGVAAHWFARSVRSETLHLLWSSQNPDLPDVIDYGKDCHFLPFAGDDDEVARFLEVADVRHIRIGPRHGKAEWTSVPIAIAADSRAFGAILKATFCPVHEIGGGELYSKYMIPQLAARRVNFPDSPFTVTFDGWYAGLA